MTSHASTISPQLLAAWFIMLCGGMLHADEVVARLRPSVVLPGQRVMLEIEALESSLDRVPEVPNLPGFRINPQGGNRVRRGNETAVVTYTVLEPESTGVIPIPAISVPLAGGRIGTTHPLELTVVTEEEAGPAPEPNKRAHCILLTPRRTFFTGEQFPIQVLVLVDPQVNLQNIEPPKLPREGFAIDRFENPLRGEVAFAGRKWLSFAFTARATAMGSGEMSLGPLETKVEIGVPEEGGNGFFQRYRNFPLTTIAPPKVLTVKPFPPNPPPGFEGTVGKFTLEAAFDPQPTRPDDPVAVKITVRGVGDGAQISVPKLADESGWEFFEGTKSEGSRDSSDLRSEVTFRRILRPTATPGATLPPFQLVFLNPATGGYETVKSNALPLPTLAGTTGQSPRPPVGGIEPALATPPNLPNPASVTPKQLLLTFPPETQPRWASGRDYAWWSGWFLNTIGLLAVAGLGARAWWQSYAATEAGKRAACRRTFRKRLEAVNRLGDPGTRLLELMRWYEDWNRSMLARSLEAHEESALSSLQSALRSSRYALNPDASTSIPADTFFSLLNARSS